MNFNELLSNINPISALEMLVITVVLIVLAFYVERFRKNPIKIAEHRKTFFTASGIYMAALAIAIILAAIGIEVGGRNYSIGYSLEFTGGTMLEVGFPEGTGKQAMTKAIDDAVASLSSSSKDFTYKHTVQPEGSPKTIDYPNDMNTVTFTISKADGPAKIDDVKGIDAVLTDRFGKIKIVETKEIDGKVELKVRIESNDDVFETQILSDSTVKDDSDKSSERKIERTVLFKDRKEIEDLFAGLNPSIKIDRIDVSMPEKFSDSDKFNAAFIKISKGADTAEGKGKGVNLDNHEINSLLILISKNLRLSSGNMYLFKKESIGPSIGQELSQKALLALIVALAIQLIYISIRFNRKWYYGLAADIGLLHDLLVMFGIYVICQNEFDSPFVSAMMTIIGYSVMNSIVIFDRIREDLKLTNSSEPFTAVVNRACNQTMTRSMNTLITVLITLFALQLFGGVTLRSFAFALIIGCIAGAYSSVFLVPSILVVFEEKIKIQDEEESDKRREKLEAAAEARRKRRQAREEELPPESEHDELDDEEEEKDKAPARKKRIIRRRRR